jgi:CheY-like chemotaxis protein
MRPIRVLMAEDEILAAEVLEEALAEAGFAVLAAQDGQAALELADCHGFDVLLTDLRMPRLDGHELIRRLRGRRPDLPVVVMTGYEVVDHESALRTGGGPLRLLTKPLRLHEVVAALIDVAASGTVANDHHRPAKEW